MQGITTHVLDISLGLPAANVPIRLERHHDGAWHSVGIAITNDDGRAQPLTISQSDSEESEQEPFVKGDYRLTFEVAAYFKSRDVKALYPFVQITFTVSQIKHHHVPLLLSPFGYSTYLGS